ncbi:MAG: GNAT family N-acetyltransferase, partial [Ktedonobacterales bacterium]
TPSPTFPTLLPVAEEIIGPRLVLCRHRVADADELLTALTVSRPLLRPWLGFHEPLTTGEATRDWLIQREAKWQLREELGFCLRLGATGAYLGSIDLHTINWREGFLALGYWLRIGAEGHGYMREAVGLATDYAFTALGIRQIGIHCDARNHRSAAVATHCGFTLEAHLRADHRAYDNVLADTLQFVKCAPLQ